MCAASSRLQEQNTRHFPLLLCNCLPFQWQVSQMSAWDPTRAHGPQRGLARNACACRPCLERLCGTDAPAMASSPLTERPRAESQFRSVCSLIIDLCRWINRGQAKRITSNPRLAGRRKQQHRAQHNTRKSLVLQISAQLCISSSSLHPCLCHRYRRAARRFSF